MGMKNTTPKYMIQNRTFYVQGRQIESLEVVNAKTGKLYGFASTHTAARAMLARANASCSLSPPHPHGESRAGGLTVTHAKG